MRIAFLFFAIFYAQTSFATFQAAEESCPGCHNVLIDGVMAVGTGSGGRNCAQRSEADWIITIDRMNAKNCGATDVAGIANYLANFDTNVTTTTSTVTTTTSVQTTTTTTQGDCPSNSHSTPPTCTCNTGYSMVSGSCIIDNLASTADLPNIVLIFCFLALFFMGFNAGLIR